MSYATATATTVRRGRRAAAASLIAVAALALTACGSADSDAAAQGGSSSASPAQGKNAADHSGAERSGAQKGTAQGDTAEESATGGGSAAKSGGAADDTTAKSGSASARQVPCTASMLKLKVQTVPRPINHVLLTATNTSGRTCNFAAQAYPFLRFDDGQQAVTPVFEDSKPQAVVSLAPGEAAYAGVMLSSGDSAEKPVEVSKIGVAVSRDVALNEVPVQGGPVSVQPSVAQVTYWQRDMSDALMW